MKRATMKSAARLRYTSPVRAPATVISARQKLRLLMPRNFSYLPGCASISLRGGGHTLAAIMPELRERQFVEPALRVVPRRGVSVDASLANGPASLPPLRKACLRMGCRIGDEACRDPELQCADVFVLLDAAAMSARHAQRFLKAG